jgi:hypothetical protein
MNGHGHGVLARTGCAGLISPGHPLNNFDPDARSRPQGVTPGLLLATIAGHPSCLSRSLPPRHTHIHNLHGGILSTERAAHSAGGASSKCERKIRKIRGRTETISDLLDLPAWFGSGEEITRPTSASLSANPLATADAGPPSWSDRPTHREGRSIRVRQVRLKSRPRPIRNRDGVRLRWQHSGLLQWQLRLLRRLRAHADVKQTLVPKRLHDRVILRSGRAPKGAREKPRKPRYIPP